MEIEKEKEKETKKQPENLQKIIEEGLSGEISLIGYPFDIGCERDKIQKGQDHGPDCMRRFLGKTGSLKNQEYDINIENLKISDYGNIWIPGKEQQILEEVAEKLQIKISRVFSKKNIPFIIGGSKDTQYSALKSILNDFPQPYCLTLSSEYQLQKQSQNNQNKITSKTFVQKFLSESEEKIKNKQFQIEYLGIQQHNINQEDIQKLETFKNFIKTVNLNEIRRFPTNQNQIQNLHFPISQAGKFFLEKLSQLKNKQIHLSVALESIQGCYTPGVTKPSVIGGFNCEEIQEIMFQAGKSENIQSVDITDYNPSKEDYRTGMLLVNMLYYFALGYSIRKNQ
ncbi:hypothetical protein PPERSA_02719 [Pseudocohnilembus persalinus]|uniref:Uncharacterized protein n=1 Tax=Pseudocohnilembus persalinus TaxID=266149 RepID=A0A0V0R5U2_PSEPJ|nr:hypothetical protein PPERSA_02719 [Pseudocohnilembus persalinus]|eukprot:KRX09847.1 hypothetical protein PPERSA_02719 [Pseudocohnilembus persalinus]